MKVNCDLDLLPQLDEYRTISLPAQDCYEIVDEGLLGPPHRSLSKGIYCSSKRLMRPQT